MLVGVDSWERAQPQPVQIDVRVHTDVARAGQSDHLPHSLHYGVLVKELERHARESQYRSLEALAVSELWLDLGVVFRERKGGPPREAADSKMLSAEKFD